MSTVEYIDEYSDEYRDEYRDAYSDEYNYRHKFHTGDHDVYSSTQASLAESIPGEKER
jgi:hypothetical protein